MAATSPASFDGVSTAARISSHVVQQMSTYTGRGPTKAWTSIDDELDQRRAARHAHQRRTQPHRRGRSELVLETRKAYQNTMRHDLVAGVEQITGRTVIAFLSDNHLDPDIAVESFVLKPRDAGPAHEK